MDIRNKIDDEDVSWGATLDQSVASSDNPENLSHHRKNPKKEYEYYITYLEHERRNDRWVTEVCLRIDEEKVNFELNKLEDKQK